MPAPSTPKVVFLDGKTYAVSAVKQGGMGRVWLLTQPFDDPFDPIYRRRLAVKTFDFAEDQAAIEQELNVWISIDHPNAVPLKKIGRLNYRLAAIMPLLQGTLDDELESVGCFAESDVLRVLIQATSALNHAWTKHGVLHLDIKPSNILLKDGEAKTVQIADWGISRLAHSGTDRTRALAHRTIVRLHGQVTSYMAGTPLYMSPERYTGSWKFSPSADVYSLGMLAIHLLCGTLPFRFGQLDPIDEIQSASYVQNAQAILATVAREVREMILKCIAPRPADRFQTFQELLVTLKRLK